MSIIIYNNYSISRMSSFKNSGTVSRFIIFETIADIQDYLACHDHYFILGKGSNVVLNDQSLTRDIIKISPSMFPITCSGTVLEAGAGVTVNELMKFCQIHGLTGLEFMAGVPASVGGMVAMNFGCWGEDISQKLHSVLAIDSNGHHIELVANQCQFLYRDSLFQRQNLCILKATFLLNRSTSEKVRVSVVNNIQKRLESQPLRGLTFGSIFKNPEGDYAARILDDLGLKGYQKGAVCLSDQHANFMINRGEASFLDVFDFIQEIRAVVKEKKGMELEMEVKLVQ